MSARDAILREIISNSLAHRDYSSGYVAKMIIEKDQILAENSNRTHGYRNLDLNTFQPFPKNPAISKVFREIGLADELGSGMRNTYKYTKMYSGGVPQFVEGDIFRTVIPLNDAATLKSGPKVSDQVSDQDNSIALEREILKFCRKPKSKKEILDHVGYKNRTYLTQKRIVDFKDRDEVKITADIQDAIGNVLNSKYGLHIAREYTMGRSEKKIGETDLYIYKEVDGWVEDCVIIENKYIEKFDRQYDQLIGYLNCNFEAGVTLSMNRNKSLKEGFDIIERKLHEKRRSAEVQCPPVSIERIEKGKVRYIVSEHIVPETKEKMKLYHLIFQLNDDERHKAAINARK